MIMKPAMFLNGRKFKVVKILSEREMGTDSPFVYKVMLGRHKCDNEYVMKKILCQTEERYQEAVTELKIMSEMSQKSSSPYILKLVDSCTTINRRNHKEVYILTSPYICSLQNVIDYGNAVYSDACPPRGFPHCPFYDGLDAVMILRQCCEGLEALHTCGYRHGDLHPGTILLRANLQAVLSDFSNVTAIPQQLNSRADALAVEERAAQHSSGTH
jgi:serine/threonine protein kinase